ncbi:adenylate/guanylate cyclase domain-containing protein [Sedimentitalea sp.]|uniref:adenylate/guanylate cyclase domain-containing protein n=1 Tax=Sedimentitalea sp. TaxID=2048915 RepID=UPI003299D325
MQILDSPSSIAPNVTSAEEKQVLINREIRIQQSVEIQKFLPITIIGSILLVIVLFLTDPALIVSSGAIAANLLTGIMLTIMLRSYLRVRHRPRPEDVSHRRIRSINIGAALNGFAWVLFSLLALRFADPVVAMTIVLGTTAFAFAALVAQASLPRTALLTALPVIIANGLGVAAYGHLPIWFSVLFSSALIITAIFCVSANWEKIKENVQQQIENTLAQARRNKEKELLSRRLGKYLSPQLYDAILTGEQTDEVIATRKKLTIFISDIVRFTEITDRLESEELSVLLNHYLTEMSTIAQAHGGTIDKFIGDAVVVYFGDPKTKGVKEDAAACVRMAIAMQDRVHELKQEWLDLGLEESFDLRIGINTGYCTVGNFGSDMRMDYTIIGGEVNLAARLEAAADVGGILLANETHALVKDWVNADEDEPLSVKGFSRPVRTFKLRSVSEGDTSTVQSFRLSEPHLSLTMNTSLMSAAERSRSATVLREVLENIEGRISD